MASEACRFFKEAVLFIILTFSLTPGTPAVLSDMLRHFGNTQFLLYESQVFPPYATESAFDTEEVSFKQTIRVVPLQNIFVDANIISS